MLFQIYLAGVILVILVGVVIGSVMFADKVLLESSKESNTFDYDIDPDYPMMLLWAAAFSWLTVIAAITIWTTIKIRTQQQLKKKKETND